MIHDLERETPRETAKFDVCIVGAGAAGIALAVELLRHGKRVVLLEGGGARYEERSQSLYHGESIGLPYKGLDEGRMRILGGTTIEWGGQILEPDELVLKPRDWIAGSGWPFAKDTLKPYYARALEFEGLKGALADDREVWRALGVTPPDFGDGVISAFSRWCPKTNFAAIHADTLKTHPRLEVYLHANACELVLAKDRGSVSSIRCRTLTGKEAHFSADDFVLCMGGLETSRFMLQPGGGETQPWSRNGMLGRHFQDHAVCYAADILDIRLQPVQAYFDYVVAAGYKYHPKMKLTPEIQRRHRLLDVCGTVGFVIDERDVLERAYRTVRLLRRRRFGGVKSSDVLHLLVNAPTLAWHVFPRLFGRARSRRRNAARMKLCVHCEQSPLSESRITLSSERDRLGLFRARVDWRVSPQELATIRFYVRFLSDAFARQQIGHIEPDPDLFADDGRITRKISDNFHHLGGTRMAASPAEGIVDPDLKIFELDNAYICSTSVFPCAGFANPTHTLLALSFRLAEHLALKAPPCAAAE